MTLAERKAKDLSTSRTAAKTGRGKPKTADKPERDEATDNAAVAKLADKLHANA